MMDVFGAVSTAQIPIPWHRVRAWIDEQESTQSAPSGISRIQIAALSCLVSFVDEPDFAERDFVSELMVYAQSRRYQSPVFKISEPLEVPVAGAWHQKWRCACILPWCNTEFPQLGYGFGPGEQAPLFASKKKAKQFAAKEALAYLTKVAPKPSAPVIPSIAREVRSSAPGLVTPARTPPKIAPAMATAYNGIVLSQTPPNPPSSTHSSSLPPLVSSPDRSEDSTVFHQVANLSGRLGIGTPSYWIEPEKDRPNFFRGHAVFHSGARVPSNIAVVTGVLGKKQAKLQLAEMVREWMALEEQRRGELIEDMLSG